MKNLLKLALIAFAVYVGFMYWAGGQNVLNIGTDINALPTWSYTPRGTVPDIGTPSVPNSHGVLEAAWPVDPYGNQFYPLGDGYTNNTSYPLLRNNYPI